MNSLAIFDLDHTLISCDSDVQWPKFLLSQGLVDAEFVQKSDEYYEEYQQGTMNADLFLKFQLAPFKLLSKTKWDKLHVQFMQDYIRPYISSQAKDLVRAHQEENDDVVLLSATNEFIITPIAHEFGIKHIIGVQLVTDSAGNLTGDYYGIPSFQSGKIRRLEMWLQENNKTLSAYNKTYFYSDSRNDLPLLKEVGFPVAVNPDEVLREYALQNNWEIIEF